MENIDLIKLMPPLLSGAELITALIEIPDYDASIRDEDIANRLMKLPDIYKIYSPSTMSIEIYNKMYLATMLSLKKKNSQLAIKQKNSNFMAMQGKAEYRGIIGGSDSFTIIGTSGIGKSSAIQKSIELISSNKLLNCDNTKIIPCIQVQCPFDASPKGMLMSVLKAVDDALDTDYYIKSQKQSVTTDILIGSVAQVCINHIGLLVIDEIQHVYGHKNGIMLINMITQLINVSGVSICLVGTEESISFFERSPQLARRTIGLKYNPLPYDDYFKEFCELVFSYQYTKKKVDITEPIAKWLYEHSGGIISVVIAILYSANEIAILNGTEEISIGVLTEAYETRIAMFHKYVCSKNNSIKNNNRIKREKDAQEDGCTNIAEYASIPELVEYARIRKMDTVEYLKEYLPIEEVSVP